MSAVRHHDRPADRQAQAESLWPKGDERLEHGVQLICRNPGTAVRNRDIHEFTICCGLEHQAALARAGPFHRVTGIEHEIEEDLLQLDAIAEHRR
jgi:hypothetical protein